VVLLDSKSSILRKVSACPRGPKAVWFRLTKFLLEALIPRFALRDEVYNTLKQYFYIAHVDEWSRSQCTSDWFSNVSKVWIPTPSKEKKIVSSKI